MNEPRTKGAGTQLREISDRLWEHNGIGDRIDARYLRDVEETLERIADQQPKTLAMIRREGFVFETPLGKPDDERTEAERWEKLAFTLYNRICESDSIARAALERPE